MYVTGVGHWHQHGANTLLLPHTHHPPCSHQFAILTLTPFVGDPKSSGGHVVWRPLASKKLTHARTYLPLRGPFINGNAEPVYIYMNMIYVYIVCVNVYIYIYIYMIII